MRQNALLLTLLLLCAALGAYLWRTRPQPAGEEEVLLPAALLQPPRPDGGPPPPLLLGLVARVPGEAAPVALSLRRHEVEGRGRWWLEGPGLRERADDELGEELYRQLLSARVLRRLPGALGDGRRYGLDDRGWRARLLLPGGRTLRVGEDAPGDLAYAAWEGGADVLLIEGRLVTLLRADRGRFRRWSVLTAELTEEPREIGLGAVTLRRRPSSWVVSDGRREGRARLEEVRALLLLLRNVRPQLLLDGRGLPFPGDFPQLRAPILLRPGEVVDAPAVLRIDGTERLFYGPPCPTQPGAVYAVRTDGARLCLTAEDGARLRPAYDALRDPRLLPFPARDVTRVQLGGARLEGGGAERGRWLLDGRPADGAEALRFLDELAAVTGTPAPPGTEARPGGAAVIIETAAGDRVSLRPAACPGPCVLRDGEEPLLIAAAALPLLQAAPLRFTPRTLLSLPPTAATAVVIERRSAPAEEARRADGGPWALARPVRAPADSVHLGRLLALLSELRALRWAAPEPRPEHALGLLQLTVRAGEAQHRLLVGAAAPQGCYARRADGGPVAVLEAGLCTALEQPLVTRDLLQLDEARLREVVILGPRRGRRRVLTRQGAAYQLDGRELTDAAPLLGALRALATAEPAGYGAPGTAPPLLRLEVRHEPLQLPASPGSSVAPEWQTLALYGARRSFTARLGGREVSYRITAEVQPLLHAVE